MIQSFKMALRSIGSSKMRAVLTMLGIVIGVFALVVLVSLVSGATDSITDAVSDLGSSMITVRISDDKGEEVTLCELYSWMDSSPELTYMAPEISDTVIGRHGGNYSSVTIYGTTPAYYEVQGLQLTMGRFLTHGDLDNESYVCVINQTAATELIGYEDCVGQTLTLDGVEFTVIGILEDDEDSLTSIFTAGSKLAYIPFSSLLRLSDTVTSEIDSFYIGATEGSTLAAAEDVIGKILYDRFDADEDAYSISSSSILEEAMDDITSVLSILLGGIAAISLVVGGVGIMNIMMVTVTERTREIGIRKAIGASRTTILMQFLMEAVVICMLGCALGIFLSWAVLQVISSIVASTGLVFTLNGSVVIIAVVFCFIIGIIFGLYPANKAAKMKPIDALHYGG